MIENSYTTQTDTPHDIVGLGAASRGGEEQPKRGREEERCKRYTLRPYGKSELALAYTQGRLSERAALNWLHTEIEHYPGLSDRLRKLGYYSTQKMFTLAQVRAIFEAIGEP